MDANVEIKASVADRAEVVRRAAELPGVVGPSLLKQHDIFYDARSGRLKLRSVNVDGVAHTELIWYDRPDAEGPKVSDFTKVVIGEDAVAGLKDALSLSMGVVGEVKKQRTLYIYENTRIHIDTVEGLGEFMELEVRLTNGRTTEEGEQLAFEIMEKLGVTKDHLLSGAYMDMLNKK